MPDDKDESSSDDMEIGSPKNNVKKKPVMIDKKQMAKMRKMISKMDGKPINKSPIVDKYIGKELKVNYKNPVRSKYKPTSGPEAQGQPRDTGSIKDFIDMARKGQNFKMDNKLRNKLQGKKK